MEVRNVRTVMLLAALVFVGQAFAQDMAAESVTTDSQGFVAVPSAYGPAETTRRLTDSLEDNPNITLLGVVNHAEAAASVDLHLSPTLLILFGNPALGTPLMQQSRSVAIDLPQKLLVWQADNGVTYVGYNTPGYLASRHGLPHDLDQLKSIQGALSNFASSVSAEPEDYRELLSEEALITRAATIETAEGSGLTTVTSTVDFETTVSNLRGALQERGFRIPFVVEHSRSAAANDFELLPTTLFIFGNPSVGTPLMQLESRVAVDLPQKMLVWEDGDGTVRITYNDPQYVLRRHDVEDMPASVDNIAEALSAIAAASAER